jgi:D-arabinose 1-dehydrogenase-like Zn-dependent alcohol dehydrogenase
MTLYMLDNCIQELQKLLNGNKLSAVIDGAGGPLYAQYPKVMRTGGILVNYGQTANIAEGIKFTMHHVVKNIELKGSTMGSRAEFHKMVQFVDQHRIKPIVSHVWKGLSKSSFEEAVSTMR